ncbi:hypothetical protein NF27_CG01160 [Candidatus Jidaibacter acanthamoeba]|uniref:MBG domain-containing protein n=1 Tax=Candidatus Jidaibacter acanthamoebae TaxID=86105 RepID=A0A0C1N0U2_9RICK|nr:hypothetical protein [Candidatus Jidaibacter acanthamoeba]KIE05936.1 hypothetical protein NF27_CG01160 [Candidatus Jidaibacter acanthamoeba]
MPSFTIPDANSAEGSYNIYSRTGNLVSELGYKFQFMPANLTILESNIPKIVEPPVINKGNNNTPFKLARWSENEDEIGSNDELITIDPSL